MTFLSKTTPPAAEIGICVQIQGQIASHRKKRKEVKRSTQEFTTINYNIVSPIFQERARALRNAAY